MTTDNDNNNESKSDSNCEEGKKLKQNKNILSKKRKCVNLVILKFVKESQ